MPATRSLAASLAFACAASAACGTQPAADLDLDPDASADTSGDAPSNPDTAGDATPDPDTADDAGIDPAPPDDVVQPNDTEPNPTDTRPPPDGIDADPIEIPPWPTVCTAADTLSVVDRPRWNEMAIFGFTPDNGQVWLVHHGDWEGSAVRILDGALIGRPFGGGVAAMDAAWSRAASVVIDEVAEVVVRDTSSLRELFRSTIGNPLDGTRASIALRPGGDEVAWTRCSTLSDEQGELRVTRASLRDEADRHEAVIPVPGRTCYSYDDRTLLRFIGDALWIVPALGAEAFVLGPDLSLSGPFVLVDLPVDPDTGIGPDVVDLVVEPDARHFLVAASTGEITRWAVAGPSRLGVVATTSAGTLNTWTFAPKLRVAPLAVSPDGRRLAWASSQNAVTVGSIDGLVAASFQVEIQPDEFGGPPETDRIAGLAFSGDGNMLAVAHTGGIDVHGCFPMLLGAPPSVVDIDVNSSTRVSQATPIGWTTDAGPFAAVRIVVDPDEIPTTIFGSSTTWYPALPGEYVIEVQASNSTGDVRNRSIVNVAR